MTQPAEAPVLDRRTAEPADHPAAALIATIEAAWATADVVRRAARLQRRQPAPEPQVTAA